MSVFIFYAEPQPNFAKQSQCKASEVQKGNVFLFKFRKYLLVVNKRSRSGLKAQQALSPGHRPGNVDRRKCALQGQKRFYKTTDF